MRAERHAGGRDGTASLHDERLHRSRIRAEREPDPELAPLAADVVGGHAVDADHREQRREPAEERASTPRAAAAARPTR